MKGGLFTDVITGSRVAEWFSEMYR